MLAFKLLQVWAVLAVTTTGRSVAALARAVVAVLVVPSTWRRTSEAGGFVCAAVFLHAIWPPLVFAAAAVLLILLGQDRT